MSEAKMALRQRRNLFLRATAPDYLLCLAVSTALVYVVSYAFYSAPDLRQNVALIAVVQAVMLLALFVGSWSKRALIVSITSTVGVAAIVLGMSAVLSVDALVVPANDTGGLFRWNDAPGNLMTFGFCLVVVPVLVYVLSRRTPGLVALAIASMLSCGVVQWLYRADLAADGLFAAFVMATFVTMFAITMMYVFQTYRMSVVRAKRAKQTAFGYAFVYAAGIGAACVAVGALVFYGVLAGFGLPTIEIKPFQDTYARPIIYYTGTFHQQQVEGDETSSETNDQSEDTSQNTENGMQSQEDSGDSSGQDEGTTTLQSAYDASNWNQSFSAISYLIMDWWWVWLIVLAAAVAVVVLSWRYRRTLRLKRLDGKPYSYRVWFLYDFLSGRLARLGFRARSDLTPMEFALGSRRFLEPFAQDVNGVDWVVVTGIFQKVCYGGQEVTAEEYDRLLSYYQSFFKNARHYVGFPRWIFKFWCI